jgi:hypothetical protein
VIGNQSLSVAKRVNQGTPFQVKILLSTKLKADPLWRILRVPSKSSFKCLLLETPLWQFAMSTNLKFLPEGLQNAKCEKGTQPVRPPIPYVPPTDLHEKWETEQIKVKLPKGTKFQMPTYRTGNNKEYLVHVIAVLRLVEQKGTAAKVKEAFAAFVAVRKEISPLLVFPDDKTATKKEARKKKLNNLKEALKAKKDVAVEKAQKAYKLVCCFFLGEARTQWDRIVNEMHTKNLWTGVNGRTNKGIRVRSWISFMACIELHNLTVFPADAAEKQHYNMQQQTIKKSQQVTVRQFVSCMGVLNDYLAYLPTFYDSLIAVAGTKKMNVPFDEADLAGIVLSAVLSSWVNHYNMTHSALSKRPRALLNDLEAIKQVMDEKHQANLKLKTKEASTASGATKGSSKKRSTSGSPGELQVPKKAKPSKFCQHCKAKGGPHLTHNTKECRRYDGMGNPISLFQTKPAEAKKLAKKEGRQADGSSIGHR